MNRRKSTIDQVRRGIDHIEDGILLVVVLAMIGIATAQIVQRNFFDSGLVWADPLLRIMVLWSGMLGAILASRANEHITIDVLSRFMPRILNAIVAIFLHAFTAAITGILAWYSYDFVVMEYEAEMIAFEEIPVWITQTILPVGFGIIALRYSVLMILATVELFRLGNRR